MKYFFPLCRVVAPKDVGSIGPDCYRLTVPCPSPEAKNRLRLL